MTRFGTDGQLLGTLNYGEAATRWDRFVCLTPDRIVGISVARPDGPYSTTVLGLLDGQLRFIADISVTRTQQHFVLDSGRTIQIPFKYPVRVWPFPDGRFVIANPEEATLLICDSDGSPNLVVERHWASPSVSRNEIEEWKSRMRGMYSESDLNRVPVPAHKPPFNNYRTDDWGFLWVQRTRGTPDEAPIGGGAVVVDFFNSSGEWLAEQGVPALPLIIQGGYAYSVPIDDEGMIKVERYKITPLVNLEVVRE
jgi:hypothetical protein